MPSSPSLGRESNREESGRASRGRTPHRSPGLRFRYPRRTESPVAPVQGGINYVTQLSRRPAVSSQRCCSPSRCAYRTSLSKIKRSIPSTRLSPQRMPQILQSIPYAHPSTPPNPLMFLPLSLQIEMCYPNAFSPPTWRTMSRQSILITASAGTPNRISGHSAS
jgi:hypothetical protein